MQEETGEQVAKNDLIYTYFYNNSRQFDAAFVRKLFDIVDRDQQVCRLIQQNAPTMLRSKHMHLNVFLESLVIRPCYSRLAAQFIYQVIAVDQLDLAVSLELSIIEKIWSYSFRQLLKQQCQPQQLFVKIVAYLSLKMRSLDLPIRTAATKSFYNMITTGIQPGIGTLLPDIRMISPQIIEKESLVKQVTFVRGVFLQILEDESHVIRVTSVRCLANLRHFLRWEDLKLIIIYMLNDEHQLVRQQALESIKLMNDLLLSREDLETILMCFKEKNQALRLLAYECLSNVTLISPSDLLPLVDRLHQALQVYKADKKKIYRLLHQLGVKYSDYISDNFSKLYSYSEEEQANFKSITYKAKIVLIYPSWVLMRQRQAAIPRLPSYFLKHALYVNDVEQHVFEQDKSIEEKSIYQNSMTLMQQSASQALSKCILNNIAVLDNYLASEQNISEGFHRELLGILRAIVRHKQTSETILRKLQAVMVDYQLEPYSIGLVNQMEYMVSQQISNQPALVREIVDKCLKNRNRSNLLKLKQSKNVYQISRNDTDTLMASSCLYFLNRLYIRCLEHHLLAGKHSNVPNTRHTLVFKLTDLSLVKKDSNYNFYRLDLGRYDAVECLVVYSLAPVQLVRVADACELDKNR